MVRDINFEVRQDLDYNFIPILFFSLTFCHNVYRLRVIGTIMHFYVDHHVPENYKFKPLKID